MKAVKLGVALGALMIGNAWASNADAQEWYGAVRVGAVTEADVSGFDLSGDTAMGAAIGTGLGLLRIEAGVDRITANANLGVTVDAEALDYSLTAYIDGPFGFYAGAGVDYIDASATLFGTSFGLDGEGYHYSLGYARQIGSFIGEVQYTHLEADLGSGIDLSADRLTAGLRFAL